MRKLLILIMGLLALLTCALGEEEDELSILDGLPPEAVITPGPQITARPRNTVQPTPSPTAMPDYYDTDGSVTITLTCAGDLMIGADPREESAFDRERERQGKGNAFLLRNVRSIFRQDDLTIVSLKTTLSSETAEVPAEKKKSRVYRADPSYAATLREDGIDLAVLANDHSLDFGAEGLEATIKALQGADVTVSAEGQLAMSTVKGVRVAVLSYNAVDRAESVARVLPEDLAVVTPLADITVVYFHWGSERSYIPDDSQISLGRLAAENGAQLVLGSRPTHVNPIEDYHGAYIVYSMGSLCSIAPEKPADMSAFLFQVKFRLFRGQTERLSFRIIPIRIATSTEANDFCPTPLNRDTAIDSVITTLLANGADLEFAVQEYPTAWR